MYIIVSLEMAIQKGTLSIKKECDPLLQNFAPFLNNDNDKFILYLFLYVISFLIDYDLTK